MSAEISGLGVNGSEFRVDTSNRDKNGLTQRDRIFRRVYDETPDGEMPPRRVIEYLARDIDFVDEVNLRQESGVLDDVPAPKRTALLSEHLRWMDRSNKRSRRDHPSNINLSDTSGPLLDSQSGGQGERIRVVFPPNSKHLVGEARTEVRIRALDGLGLQPEQHRQLGAIIGHRTRQLARLG